ncbi:flagellin domain protein, partial [Bacteriovorax sp. DB6_IX]
RSLLILEFQSLVTEVDRIAESTKFNGKDLLNGTGDQMDFQIGINNNEGLDRIAFDPSQTSAKVGDLGIEGLTVSSKEGAQ